VYQRVRSLGWVTSSFTKCHIILGAVVFVLCAACSGSDALPDPVPTAAPPTEATPDFGPPPELGGNVPDVFPAHGTSISQADTVTSNPRFPGPPCFEADFAGLPEQAQWFRVLVDDVEITPELTWVISASGGPAESARGCHGTSDGLSPGRHTVVVNVIEPSVRGVQPLQVVTWSFDVTP